MEALRAHLAKSAFSQPLSTQSDSFCVLPEPAQAESRRWGETGDDCLLHEVEGGGIGPVLSLTDSPLARDRLFRSCTVSHALFSPAISAGRYQVLGIDTADTRFRDCGIEYWNRYRPILSTATWSWHVYRTIDY